MTYEDNIREKIEQNQQLLKSIRHSLSHYLIFENGRLVPDSHSKEALALQRQEKKLVEDNQSLVAALKMIVDAGSIISQSNQKYSYTSLARERNENARSIEAQETTLKWLRKLEPQQHHPDARVYFHSEQERNEKITEVETRLKNLRKDQMFFDEVWSKMQEAVIIASPAL